MAASHIETDEARDAPAPLTGGYAHYAMTLLLCLYLVNFLDRQVVNILAEPIKRDLHLADWQLGLMSGLSFALFYTILGIPIGRLAERRSRPAIIGASAIAWSGFTLLSGMAQNFTQLILGRMGVGVGEAGCTPAAQSLIMDYSSPRKRGSALAYYGLGAPIGGLVGMMFGGVVAENYGWRAAFLLAGVPGLLLGCLAAFTLREPRRHLRADLARQQSDAPTIGDTIRVLRSKRSFIDWMLAVAVMSVLLAGLPPFFGSFYLRNHAAGLDDLAAQVEGLTGWHLGPIGIMGLSLGLIMGVFGAAGMWIGGRLADRYGQGNPRRHMRGAAIATFINAPLLIGVLFAPTLGLSLTFMAAKSLATSIWYGPVYAGGFSIIPANMRATTSALSLFVNNLVGMGLGPLAVGLASDLIATRLGAAEGIRWAVAAFAICGPMATLLLFRAARHADADAAAE